MWIAAVGGTKMRGAACEKSLALERPERVLDLGFYYVFANAGCRAALCLAAVIDVSLVCFANKRVPAAFALDQPTEDEAVRIAPCGRLTLKNVLNLRPQQTSTQLP